ncbi:MAG: acyl-CoA dehydrogenase, partial [Deltaproteobacteria bacterium]|nr:acyl-CoA dehydrogenase [Deltaproteobacteria bacterium]
DQEGSGFKIAMGALAKGRIGTAALATGIQQRCVDECIEYSKTRIIQNKPLGDNPVIRQYIAEMQMNAENSRMATWRAAWKLARGEDAYFESSIAKAFSTMHAEKTALQAVQILGAWGISMEYPIAKLVNDAKVLSIVEGTTEIQKNAIADVLYGKGKPLYYT